MYCLVHFIKGRLPWSDCSVSQVSRLKVRQNVKNEHMAYPLLIASQRRQRQATNYLLQDVQLRFNLL